jgi:hypothetical protein
MKKLLLFIAFSILSFSAVSQNNPNNNLQRFSFSSEDNIGEDIENRITLLNQKINEPFSTNKRDGSVLDSIVIYKFHSSDDSSRASKDEFHYYPDRKVTVYYQRWNQENLQWEDTAKVEYQLFEDTYQAIYWHRWNWDNETSDWINDQLYETTFDENGHESSFSAFMWNKGLDRWDKLFKWTKENDENGRVLVRIDWEPDGNNHWVRDYKRSKTYNGNGTMNTEQTFRWDPNIEEWSNYYRLANYYNASGLLVNDTSFRWEEDNWIFSSKTELTYTESEKLFESISSDYISGQWIYTSKTDYVYDDNDDLSMRIYSEWDEASWKYQSKVEYDYEGYTRIETRLNWDSGQNTWVYYRRYEYEYDTVNYNTMSTNYKWEFEWIGTSKMARDYNENWVPQIDFYYKWDEASKDWEIDEKKFFYRSMAVGSQEITESQFLVFPNPTKDVLNISNPEMETISCRLFNSAGKELIQIKTKEPIVRLSTTAFPDGLYLLQIRKASLIETIKIIKR